MTKEKQLTLVCKYHSSSFPWLDSTLAPSLASELSVVVVDEAGFGSLKGIVACFLINLYKATTVRSASTGICRIIQKALPHGISRILHGDVKQTK